VQVTQHVPPVKATSDVGDLPPGFSVPNNGVGACGGASSLKTCGSLPQLSQEKMSVNVQEATSSGKLREAPITSLSGSQSQQMSFSTPPSSSGAAQYYSASSVQVRLRHVTMRLVITLH
jgi:hypothetical protein